MLSRGRDWTMAAADGDPISPRVMLDESMTADDGLAAAEVEFAQAAGAEEGAGGGGMAGGGGGGLGVPCFLGDLVSLLLLLRGVERAAAAVVVVLASFLLPRPAAMRRDRLPLPAGDASASAVAFAFPFGEAGVLAVLVHEDSDAEAEAAAVSSFSSTSIGSPPAAATSTAWPSSASGMDWAAGRLMLLLLLSSAPLSSSKRVGISASITVSPSASLVPVGRPGHSCGRFFAFLLGVHVLLFEPPPPPFFFLFLLALERFLPMVGPPISIIRQ